VGREDVVHPQHDDEHIGRLIQRRLHVDTLDIEENGAGARALFDAERTLHALTTASERDDIGPASGIRLFQGPVQLVGIAGGMIATLTGDAVPNQDDPRHPCLEERRIWCAWVLGEG